MPKPDYSFQDKAVRSISATFTENPKAKTLLVIPTGGGKTRTAVKSILKLLEDGKLDKKSQVLWVAHSNELLRQAKEDGFGEESAHPLAELALSRTIFQTNVPASKTVEENDDIKLVVIDECHHAAAKTYLPLFRPGVGVLGLTATPSRHDGKALEFEGESFSIGLHKLERIGIVLKAKVISLEGITEELINGYDDSNLARLNTAKRNETMREALLSDPEQFKKVIVYVGTKKHAKDLYELFVHSDLRDHYDSISYVFGGERNNSRNQGCDDFFKEEKSYSRSIIINVKVLTEGYDDPRVNTVVMGTPLNSTLTYFQCMGRAIRRDKDNPEKKAFVLEITDKLPNIGYKIDNRWIYSEISDRLEPTILDKTYTNQKSFTDALNSIYSKFNVPNDQRTIPKYSDSERYQILLFKSYRKGDSLPHIPIILSNENRLDVQKWFNHLSRGYRGDNGSRGRLHNVNNRDAVMEEVSQWWGNDLDNREIRLAVLAAMENSGLHIAGGDESASKNHPWITLVSLEKDEENEGSELISFLEGVLNKEEILDEIKNLKDKNLFTVIKFPLPLAGYVARVATHEHWTQIDGTLTCIKAIADNPQQTQAEDLRKILMQGQFPFETSLIESLPVMIREPQPYHLSLS
jgi:superfamily II DNA or RNA helicase